jgi:hypothetical protein
MKQAFRPCFYQKQRMQVQDARLPFSFLSSLYAHHDQQALQLVRVVLDNSV